MSRQPRAAKILICLVIAMTAGAAVLLALDNQAITAGAFSLASYSSLGSIRDVIVPRSPVQKGRWDRIEIFYSKSKGGNLAQLASLNGLSSGDDVNFHFLICNNLGAIDGQIIPSEKWLNQWSAICGGLWYGSSTTIRICIVGQNNGSVSVSDYQISRTEELIEALSRKFDIPASDIAYPKDWQI